MRYHRNTISQRVKKRPEPLLSQGFRRPCQGVDATGFEPATSASRTQRSTKLSHASMCFVFVSFASNSFSISHLFTFVNNKFQNFLIFLRAQNILFYALKIFCLCLDNFCIFPIGGNQFLIPVERLFPIPFHRAFTGIISVHIDKTISLLHFTRSCTY